MQGIVFDIKRFALHDGPGIRTTVFFKGCPMRCLWCHNPESQRTACETINRNLRIGETVYPETVTVGLTKTVDEVMREIGRDRIYYEESGGGVTFSGGEPLEQPDFLRALARACREGGIHTVLDTSGYSPEDIFNSLIDEFDLFYYDLKIADNDRHIRGTGVPNDRIFNNLKTLSRRTKDIVIRFPVIPNYTDDRDNVEAVSRFLLSLGRIHRIHILSFNTFALHKYIRLNRDNLFSRIPPPDMHRINEIQTYFQSQGFIATAGG